MFIGIDWGGTKIEGIALSAAGKELARLREDTPRNDYAGCLATIGRIVARLEKQTGQTGSVGVGLPGSLDPETGLGKGCNSTWLIGRPVKQDLERALARPVRAENDADCLAASEAADGAGAGYGVVAAVILGTGVGAGIAFHGRVHHGAGNAAGEWGHHPLPFPTLDEVPGDPCYCGRRGCVETWCSGTALQNDWERHTGVRLKGAEIIARKRAGDPLAAMVWERYVDRVARGLTLVVNILDPHVFVLGGGMSNVDELYADLPPRIARHTFSRAFKTPILRARHGDSSGVRGAAWLWKDHS